jgi:lactate dehydrogenase-like 2-hydroxyacid dehydrogenase
MTDKPAVFVTRIIPENGLALVRQYCSTQVWMDELPPMRADLLERVKGVQGILSLLTDRIDDAVIESAGPQLKVISNMAVGVDNIDLAAATRRGIPVGHTPGILTDATADFTFALMMAAARRVVEGERYVREGKWKTWGPTLLLGRDVAGATLGIIGYGRIGKAVSRRAEGFGMRILFCDPNQAQPVDGDRAKAVDLDTLLRESDFITLHTPLNEATHHLINAAAFAKMKPTAILINTARGPIVDPEALYQALKEKRIFAAGLDVTEPEPLPANSLLLTLDNLVIAPHIASASQSTRSMMAQIAAENLLAGLRGERLPHCVNPQAYSVQRQR